jgi:hypothetical protein
MEQRRRTQLPVRDTMVLSAPYTERAWRWVLTRRLHHLLGAVESMPGVRAEYFGAYFAGRTRAPSPTGWLTELAVSDAQYSSALRKGAVHECECFAGTYQRARGNGPNIAPRVAR